MIQCKCGAQMPEGSKFCTRCGCQFSTDAPQQDAPQQNPYQQGSYQQNPYQQAYPQYGAPIKNTDHTAEFTAEQVSENKVYAALCYINFIFAFVMLIAKKDDSYLNFHIKQALKIYLCSALTILLGLLTSFLVITVLAMTVIIFILQVVNLICLFKTLAGKSEEAPIISGLKFL